MGGVRGGGDGRRRHCDGHELTLTLALTPLAFSRLVSQIRIGRGLDPRDKLIRNTATLTGKRRKEGRGTCTRGDRRKNYEAAGIMKRKGFLKDDIRAQEKISMVD